MLFFKKRKKKKEEIEELTLFDDSLNIEDVLKHHTEKDKTDKLFDEIENLQYIRTQCEQVVESSKYINELKIEYEAVNSYLSDIQIIDSLKKDKRELINEIAEEIVHIEKRRDAYRNEKAKLPTAKTQRFIKYEDEFPKALQNLQNDEKYLQAVKHDMRVLEAEKVSLKEDIDNYRSRRVNIRNISVISLLAIVAVFIIFFAAGKLGDTSTMTMFMVILLLVAVYVFLIFFMQRNSLYRIKISEKKLQRAITLLNKVKIKYVNIVNSVDYQLAKYDVKNAYQLGNEYELFLDDKRASERYKSSSVELEDAEKRLDKALKALNLYDEAVWNSQIEALVDPKEMVEVKHKLNIRRQKLKEQIDYNLDRIDDAKKGVKKFIKQNPQKADLIMEIVDSYDIN